MGEQGQYRDILNDFIHQQIVLYGPHLAVDTVNRVKGVQVDENGKVIGVSGDIFLILEDVIAEFQKISPQITDHLWATYLEKDPKLKEKLGTVITPTKLHSALMETKE